MESTKYDNIAAEYNSVYDDLQSLPCGLLEEANLRAVVEPHIQDKLVLDLACGSGHYSRKFLEWGASGIVGVDLSEKMIEDAKSRITAEEKGRLEFVFGDVSKDLDMSEHGAPFDIVVGTWLLNYASNVEEMTAMWNSIAANLKPGGLFLGLTIPPPLGNREELDRALREDWTPYGTGGHVTGVVDDGFAMHTVLGMPDSNKKVEFDNFYLRSDAFDRSCGMSSMIGPLEWLPLALPMDVKEKYPVGYWNRLVLNPHFRICCARR